MIQNPEGTADRFNGHWVHTTSRYWSLTAHFSSPLATYLLGDGRGEGDLCRVVASPREPTIFLRVITF